MFVIVISLFNRLKMMSISCQFGRDPLISKNLQNDNPDSHLIHFNARASCILFVDGAYNQ